MIELWADYFDTTYAKEVTEMGFGAPSGRYNIYIGNTNGFYSIGSGVYGYASSVGYIVVRENYNSGFPSNTDPEGSNKGAMKVTAAHEFHHALQYLSDSWVTNSDAWWMEATSTWMEDAVFNQVNDYVNYLGSWTSYPYTSLTLFNNSHEYGDVIWSKYLSETYATSADTDGSNVFLGIWQKVASLGPLGAIDSYLQGRGSTLKAAYHNFAVKNLKMDYSEGASYGTMALAKTESSHPLTRTLTTALPDYLGCNYVRFNFAQAMPIFYLAFAGSNIYDRFSIEWRASVLINNGVTTTVEAIPLDANNQGTVTLYNLTSSNILTLVASVVSPTGIGTYGVAYGSYPNGVPFTYHVQDSIPAESTPLAIKTALNYPNPFANSTTFYVQTSRSAEIEIAIYDLSGVLQKKLYGSGSTIVRIDWDARDSGGQALANGVYFYLVKATDSSGNVTTKKGKCTVLWKN